MADEPKPQERETSNGVPKPVAAREARLAAALRANLRRRKAAGKAGE